MGKNREFPGARNYVAYYIGWGKFAQKYYDVSIGDPGGSEYPLQRQVLSAGRLSDSTHPPGGDQERRVVPIRAHVLQESRVLLQG